MFERPSANDILTDGFVEFENIPKPFFFLTNCGNDESDPDSGNVDILKINIFYWRYLDIYEHVLKGADTALIDTKYDIILCILDHTIMIIQ